MAGQPPPSPGGSSASASSSWAVDPSPLRHQCITELLHDPRAASRMPDIASFASFAASPASNSAPRPPPATINDFAAYLRDVQEPYRTFVRARTLDEEARERKTAPPSSALNRSSSRAAPLHRETSDRTALANAKVSADVPVDVPAAYFSELFSVAHCDELASLQNTATTICAEDSAVADLRATLGAYQAHLEGLLHEKMGAAREEVASALKRVRELRDAVATASAETRCARADAEAVVAGTASGAVEIHALGHRKENAIRLKVALSGVARILSAADDAHVLIDAGEYMSAMRAVEGARASLAQGDLARIAALAPARAKLAFAVERIDVALRDEFRVLISASRVDTDKILQVVHLVARLGRSQLALRAFIDDVRKSLDKQLGDALTIDAAALAARSAVKRAALINTTFAKAMTRAPADNADVDATGKDAVDDKSEQVGITAANLAVSEVSIAPAGFSMPSSPAAAIFTFEEAINGNAPAPSKESSSAFSTGIWHGSGLENHTNAVLGTLYDEILDMLCGVVDRLLRSFDGKSEYIVLTPDEEVTELNCFDEAKGALRFSEAMRSLDVLGNDIIATLGLESTSSRRPNALRAKVSERSLAYVTALHNVHVEAITKAVHSDRWAEVRVSPGVSRLVAGVTGDMRRSFDGDGISSANDATAQHSVAAGLQIHKETFKTTASGLRYTRSVCAFALFSEKLPYASSESARRGVELSRLFNALCGRAILGASAIQWSGLRSITARHLSLASRTIALAIALSPHICSSLQNAVAESHAAIVGTLMRKAEKDFRDHHGQLLAKIMSIMMDRLAVHEEGLLALPWDKSLEMNRFDIPSMYITTLAKEAFVLHKILWSLLPHEEVVDIFQRVLDAYGSRLSSGYGVLDTEKPWVRSRIIADVVHVHDLLFQLDVIQSNPEMFQPITRMYQRYVVDLRKAASVRSEISSQTPAPDGPLFSEPNGTSYSDTVADPGEAATNAAGVSSKDHDKNGLADGLENLTDGSLVEEGASDKTNLSIDMPGKPVSKALHSPSESRPVSSISYCQDQCDDVQIKKRFLSLSSYDATPDIASPLGANKHQLRESDNASSKGDEAAHPAAVSIEQLEADNNVTDTSVAGTYRESDESGLEPSANGQDAEAQASVTHTSSSNDQVACSCTIPDMTDSNIDLKCSQGQGCDQRGKNMMEQRTEPGLDRNHVPVGLATVDGIVCSMDEPEDVVSSRPV
jgi:Vps54-like protein